MNRAQEVTVLVSETFSLFIFKFCFKFGAYRFFPLSRIKVYADKSVSLSFCLFTIIKDK